MAFFAGGLFGNSCHCETALSSKQSNPTLEAEIDTSLSVLAMTKEKLFYLNTGGAFPAFLKSSIVIRQS